jgi:hypothetical protein
MHFFILSDNILSTLLECYCKFWGSRLPCHTYTRTSWQVAGVQSSWKEGNFSLTTTSVSYRTEGVPLQARLLLWLPDDGAATYFSAQVTGYLNMSQFVGPVLEVRVPVHISPDLIWRPLVSMCVGIRGGDVRKNRRLEINSCGTKWTVLLSCWIIMWRSMESSECCFETNSLCIANARNPFE